MNAARSNLTVLALAALVSFAIDQASKFYITHGLGLDLYQIYPVIDGILTFTHTRNYGINFGWFQMPQGDPRPQYALIALSVVVSIALAVWAARRWRDAPFSVAVGMVIGGALGNAIDRFRIGAVTDFLNVTCCGINNPYAFNIADVAIFAGVALLFLRTSGDEKRTVRE